MSQGHACHNNMIVGRPDKALDELTKLDIQSRPVKMGIGAVQEKPQEEQYPAAAGEPLWYPDPWSYEQDWYQWQPTWAGEAEAEAQADPNTGMPSLDALGKGKGKSGKGGKGWGSGKGGKGYGYQPNCWSWSPKGEKGKGKGDKGKSKGDSWPKGGKGKRGGGCSVLLSAYRARFPKKKTRSVRAR